MSDAEAMDDMTLARSLVPDDVKTGLAIVRKLTPDKRAAYERMIYVADELNAGRIPPGVMVD
jgi:hypothetical protein